MEAPKKLYIDTEDRLSDSILYGFTEKRKEDDIEYIRKDIVGDMLSTAEDHAYLAGQEAMREQMIDKAVEWLKAYIHYDDFGGNMEWLVPFENDKCMIQHFKTYMEE